MSKFAYEPGELEVTLPDGTEVELTADAVAELQGGEGEDAS
jgi:hypothetical protein